MKTLSQNINESMRKMTLAEMGDDMDFIHGKPNVKTLDDVAREIAASFEQTADMGGEEACSEVLLSLDKDAVAAVLAKLDIDADLYKAIIFNLLFPRDHLIARDIEGYVKKLKLDKIDWSAD